MRTIETTVYTFAELSEDAKEQARDNFRQSSYLDDICRWNWQEASQSRDLFLREFSAELRYGSCQSESVRVSPHYWQADGALGDLSYVRLWKYINANHADCISKIGHCQFTGVCWDEVLLDGIAEFMRKPYKIDFKSLLYLCCEDLRIAVEAECEYQNSDEAIDESIECNGYEFTQDGEIV